MAKPKIEKIEGASGGKFPKDKDGRVVIPKDTIINWDCGLELLTGWSSMGSIIGPPNNHIAEHSFNIVPRVKGSKII